ncbi:helix-turn-helix transcriptional regulator [Actinomyces sp. 594]|uniref:helix-turn-helix transcriptional regulator n=1 Tax=Actinomyces sp. 594 TaxID=2057793 RepID=UPI001C55FE1C|nr:LuxR C-terminal-related transcriptional regulator [Actinomyces sp. 594]MBW3069436.1 helix-turn-helix transcriptional regulator [Actinomyces sp. 594]
MHALSRRRLIAREIAERLNRGLGSLCLVAAPSVPGVWSLGPTLAADVTGLQQDVHVIEVDVAVAAALLLTRPELGLADALLIASVNQVFEDLCSDPEDTHLRGQLERLRNAVQDASSFPARAEAAGAFAAACRRPTLITIVADRVCEDLPAGYLRQVTAAIAATPVAIVVLVPQGVSVAPAVPPCFSMSISRLEPDDARALLVAETGVYVDPAVAGRICLSAEGRIADIRALGVSLTGEQLAGRELPQRMPAASAQTLRTVAEQINALPQEQRDALVALHLQLVPDADVVRSIAGTEPPQGPTDLLPGTDPARELPTVTTSAVVETATREAVRDLHAALADAYAAGSPERSWHRVNAGTADADDRDRLLALADSELQRGSLSLAGRIIQALGRKPAGHSAPPAHAAALGRLQGQLALQLGCTLTAASRLYEAMGRPGMSPEEETDVIAGYIAARGCEGLSVGEDGRLVARLQELGATAPAHAARCLVLLVAQEYIAGEVEGPGHYLRAAAQLLQAAGAGTADPAAADVLVLARALLARVEGRPDEAAQLLGEGTSAVIPADTPRGDVAKWAQAVICALMVAAQAPDERPAVVDSALALLDGVSPFYDSQAVAVRAVLAARRGWTRPEQEELEGDCYRVPLRVGLAGMGMTMVAHSAMLFGGSATVSTWRSAMAHALPRSSASPQQLWVSVLEAASRLADGDGTLAGLLLGPVVAARVPRERLRAVWSSIIDMVLIEPALLQRVPGLTDWLSARTGQPLQADPDDRLLAVLLADDAQAVPLISGLVLDTVWSGNAVQQVRAHMACAARLRRSPGLDVTELAVATDASSSAAVLEGRAAELADVNGIVFWRRVARRTAEDAHAWAVPGPTPLAPVLTDTELRVARLAAQGKRNKEIAAELYMAVRTVELRLTGVYRALGIAGRRELPKALAAHGLVDG